MILLRSFLSGHIRIKRTLEYYDAGIGPRVPFGGGFGPTVSAIFATALGDYSTLSTVSSMPTGGSITRAGNAMLYDSTGKLTWAPNNQYINSGSATNTARTITTVAGVNYYIWIQTSTGTATIVASGTNTTTFNGSTSGTFTAFTATAGTLTLTPTSNYANITQVVVAQITYETALRSGDNYVTGASAYYGPRFDYDPATLAAKGLLVEGARTNLLTYSEQFDNGAWTKTNSSITANAVIAPDGTVTADKLVENTATSSHFVNSNVTVANTTTYTYSVYAKAAERSYLTIYAINTGAAANTFFNLSTGTVVSTSSGATSAIVSVGNGWYRCSITATTTSTTSGIYPGVSADGVNASYTGNGTSGIYIWGAQLEVGSFPTSYIPATTGSLARAAETFSITGYSNRLVESFYIDEATGGSWSANIAPSATSPLTISTPSFGWVTALRAYTNAYAGDIATPSWLSFSRAGNAMYYDSTGALTYAPANQILHSNDFNQTVWTTPSTGVTMTSGQSDPFGGTSAWRLQGTTSTWNLNQSVNISGTALISFWVKSNTGSSQTFRLYGNNSTGSSDLTATTSWQRISFSFAQAGTAAMGITRNVAGATADLLIYGAQVELITYQTSPRAYISTTSAAVYQPRYDYDPSTTPATPRGLLIEESRQNLLLQSQTFNTSWTLNNILAFGSGSVADAITAPDGTTTADKIVENTSTTSHFVNQTATVTNGASYTYSVFAKAGERKYLTIFCINTAAAANTFFNLSNGTVVSTSSGATSSITSVGNGWYRCSVTTTTTSTTSGIYPGISPDGVNVSYAGDGVSGLFVWGAQLEVGSFATSYIPTTTGAVTRAADVAQLTGSALTTAGAATGTAIVQTPQLLGLDASSKYILATSLNRRLLYGALTTTVASYDGTNVMAATVGGSGSYQTGTVRAAIGWNTLGASMVANNGTVANTGSPGNVILGTGADVYLGNVAGSLQLCGWVASLALYNQRLPDAILRQKSTVGSPY